MAAQLGRTLLLCLASRWAAPRSHDIGAGGGLHHGGRRWPSSSSPHHLRARRGGDKRRFGRVWMRERHPLKLLLLLLQLLLVLQLLLGSQGGCCQPVHPPGEPPDCAPHLAQCPPHLAELRNQGWHA